MMLNIGIKRTLANHVSVAYLAHMGETHLYLIQTLKKIPRNYNKK